MTVSFSIGMGPGYGGFAPLAHTPANLDVLAAARQISDEHPGGIAALARLLDMPASTLEKKLNPNNEQHKLNLVEALRLQQVSGRRHVLQAMAAQLGCAVTTVVPDQSGGDPVDAFMRFQQQLGDFTSAVAHALQQPECSSNMYRRVQHDANELMATIAALVGVVAARVPKRGEGV